MSNIATILADIGPLQGEQLARLAKSRGRGTARRLGWLLERFRPDVDTYWLREVARPQEGSAAVLVPGNPPRGPIDVNWGLWLNGTVTPE
jgi:predicted transcriptional regulator of viral defense system